MYLKHVAYPPTAAWRYFSPFVDGDGHLIRSISGLTVLEQAIAVSYVGWYKERYRAAVEARRPNIPDPLRHLYVHVGGSEAGDGTSRGAAFNKMSDANAVAQPGDMIHMWGTQASPSIDFVISPAQAGLANAWIVYKVEDGEECTLIGADDYALIHATQLAYIAVIGGDGPDDRRLHIDPRGNAGYGSYGTLILGGLGGGTSTGFYFAFIDAEAGLVFDGSQYVFVEGNDIDIHSTVGNSGEAVSITSNALFQNSRGDHGTIYNNKCRGYGHTGIQVLSNSDPYDLISDIVVAFNDCSSPLSAGIGVLLSQNCLIVGNDVHDCATDTTSSAASKEGIFCIGINNECVANRVWNVAGPGILIQANWFIIPESCVDCHFHHNAVWNCWGQPVQILCRANQKELFDVAGVYEWDSSTTFVSGNVVWIAGAGDDPEMTYRCVVTTSHNQPPASTPLSWVPNEIYFSGLVYENNLHWDNFMVSAGDRDLNPGAAQYPYYGYYSGNYYEMMILVDKVSDFTVRQFLVDGDVDTPTFPGVMRNNWWGRPSGSTGGESKFVVWISQPDVAIPPVTTLYATETAINADLDAPAFANNHHGAIDPLFASTDDSSATTAFDVNDVFLALMANSPVIDQGYPTIGMNYAGLAPDIGVQEKA